MSIQKLQKIALLRKVSDQPAEWNGLTKDGMEVTIEVLNGWHLSCGIVGSGTVYFDRLPHSHPGDGTLDRETMTKELEFTLDLSETEWMA